MGADTIFRPEDSETEVKHLKDAELAVIETVWGHMAGGGANDEDTKWMDGKIADLLGVLNADLGKLSLSH